MAEQSESITLNELIVEARKVATELYLKYKDQAVVEVLLYLAHRLMRGATDTWIALKVIEDRENHARREN